MAYSLGMPRDGLAATTPGTGPGAGDRPSGPYGNGVGAAAYDGHRPRPVIAAPAPTMAAMRSRGDLIRVDGGARLDGAVRVAGAKNSALKLMAAALLAEGRTVL